jgi:ubiquinone/menaquinone biosynthesis C-methylase UbiE
MKIILGAGDEKIDGFVTCDYDPLCNPDYCFDLEKDTFPFEDNSVESVVANHVLEHLGEGYFHCLKEIYRVCKHGAIVHITVPHHRHDYFYNDPTHRRPITLDGLRLFSKKYNDACKEQGAAASRLAYYFKVDFEVLDFYYNPADGYREEFEGKPLKETEKYLSEHNNIISELQVRLNVVKEYES